MQLSTYLNANDVSELLNVSKPYAYTIIQKWNNELSEKGYFTIKGKIPRRLFVEKIYIDLSEIGDSNVCK